VLVGVVFARLGGVLACMQSMAVGYVGVMGCFFVVLRAFVITRILVPPSFESVNRALKESAPSRLSRTIHDREMTATLKVRCAHYRTVLFA
jgi:hypothetical protein